MHFKRLNWLLCAHLSICVLMFIWLQIQSKKCKRRLQLALLSTQEKHILLIHSWWTPALDRVNVRVTLKAFRSSCSMCVYRAEELVSSAVWRWDLSVSDWKGESLPPTIIQLVSLLSLLCLHCFDCFLVWDLAEILSYSVPNWKTCQASGTGYAVGHLLLYLFA